MIPKPKVKLTLRLLFIFVLLSLSALIFGLYLFLHRDSFKKTKATNNENVLLMLALSKPSVQKGEELTVSISGSVSAQITIIGYLGTLSFDKSKLQVKDIQYKLGSVSKDLGDDNSTLASASATGKIYLQGEIQSAQGHVLSGKTEIASIVFTALEETKPQFTFSDIKFYRMNVDHTLTELQSDSVNSSSQPDAITLTVKLKIQGYVSKASTSPKLNVKVKLGGGGLAAVTPYRETTFSPDSSGIWTGSINFASISAAQNYYLLIKGGKHVQRKICDNKPTETETSLYHCAEGKVNLINGDNVLDLSGILQFAGDLNLETGQDGGVNAADFSLINKAINSKTPVTADIIERGDINMDGVVDSQDYSLMNKTMELKVNRDEE